MTYCCGVLVRDGLVMIADTRTNAGLDNIAVFRKLHLFETPGERVVGVATSGNLAVSQSVLTLIGEGFLTAETGLVVGAEVAAMEEASEVIAQAQAAEADALLAAMAAEAEAAAATAPDLNADANDHPYPTCFVCGPWNAAMIVIHGDCRPTMPSLPPAQSIEDFRNSDPENPGLQGRIAAK